jgi:hypothetical protein
MMHVTTPLTENEKSRLLALRNCATRHEVVLESLGNSWRLSYTGRRSRQGLMEVIRQRGPDIMTVVAVGDDDVLRFNKDGSVSLTKDARVRFSGRSERGCILSGELPPLPSKN